MCERHFVGRCVEDEGVKGWNLNSLARFCSCPTHPQFVSGMTGNLIVLNCEGSNFTLLNRSGTCLPQS